MVHLVANLLVLRIVLYNLLESTVCCTLILLYHINITKMRTTAILNGWVGVWATFWKDNWGWQAQQGNRIHHQTFHSCHSTQSDLGLGKNPCYFSVLCAQTPTGAHWRIMWHYYWNFYRLEGKSLYGNSRCASFCIVYCQWSQFIWILVLMKQIWMPSTEAT